MGQICAFIIHLQKLIKKQQKYERLMNAIP